MIKSVPLGQYYPANSFVHRMDGRAKITCLLLYFIILFSAGDYLAYLLVTIFSLFLLFATKIPFKMYWRASRLLLIFIVFVAFFNIFFTPGEDVLWQWWLLTVTKRGLLNALFMTIRLTMLLLICSMLTFTTSSMALTDSIENMLSPLKRIRFPAHELAMMMSIALRFIPTFIEEADKIVKAQQARGVDFSRRGLRHLAQAIIPLVIPLFMSAFRSSEELANAMEARAYRVGEGRGHLRELRLRSSDYLAMAVFLLLASAALVYRLLLS